MHVSALWTGGIALVLGLLLLVGLMKQRRRARKIAAKFRILEGEEERMFTFLHDLGLAIGKEVTDVALSRLIVEGVLKVVGAKGGAIYHEATEPGYLSPAYVSDDCPPLIGVPEELTGQGEVDPRVLTSHLRRSRQVIGKGVVGRGFEMEEAAHVRDLQGQEFFRDPSGPYPEPLAVMVSPLRYAGREIGVLVVARPRGEGGFTKNDFAVFRSVAEQSSFAIGNARVHRDANEKKEIEGELRNAREVQRVLLPQDDPSVVGFRVSGTNLPARIISGDYYDYLELQEGRLGVVVADVSGKGVSAGLLMAMCRSLLRAVSLSNASPSVVLGAVNRYLFPDIREDMFISMIYGVLDPADGSLTFARAGHDPAMVFRKNSGEVEIFRPKGLALGIDGGVVFERVMRDEKIYLESGDCVLLFTDGVKEAVGPHEEEFGLERLAEEFREVAGLGAEAVVQRVQDAVEKFAGGGPQADDVTIVAIEKR